MAMPPLRPRNSRAPMFLRPASYRLRRKRDAARLLPFVGLFLCILPALWEVDSQDQQSTAFDGIYFFFIWAMLIGVAFVMARSLDVPDDGGDLDAVDPVDDRE